MDVFALYRKWREETDYVEALEDDQSEVNDRKAFMRYAKLRQLDEEDFEELEMQYDEYLIEQEME